MLKTSWLIALTRTLSVKRGRGAKRRRRHKPESIARQAQILQQRTLLTTVSFEPMSGFLDVTTTGGDDVTIQANGSSFEVLVNGTADSTTGNASEVYWISVTGDSGNNDINLSGVTDAEFTGWPTIDVYGGDGDDTITGSAFSDNLYGDGGADQIFGGDEYDYLSGGTGNDELHGEGDSDQVFGDEGDDILWSGAGADDDGPSNWDLDGGDGSDVLDGDTEPATESESEADPETEEEDPATETESETNDPPVIDMDPSTEEIEDSHTIVIGPDRALAAAAARHLSWLQVSDPDDDDDTLATNIDSGNADYNSLFELNTRSNGRVQVARQEMANLRDAEAIIYTLTIRVEDDEGAYDEGTLTIRLKRTSVGVLGDTQAIEGTSDQIKLKLIRYHYPGEARPAIQVKVRYRWNEVGKYVDDLSDGLSHNDINEVGAPSGGVTYTDVLYAMSAKVAGDETDDSVDIILTATTGDGAEKLESAIVEVVALPAYAVVVGASDPLDKVTDPDGQRARGSVDIQVLNGVALWGKYHSSGAGADASDVDVNDINQGGVGNCYLWTAAAIFVHNPLPDRSIQDVIRTVPGNPTQFKVHPFGSDDDSDAITVTFELTRGFGSVRLSGDTDASKNVEVWTAVLEMAYADYKGGYTESESGTGAEGWYFLTGKQVADPNDRQWRTVPLDGDPPELNSNAEVVQKIIDLHNAGNELVFESSPGAPNMSNGGHGYAILNINETDKEMTLFNPLDPSQQIIVEYDTFDFMSNCQAIDVLPRS